VHGYIEYPLKLRDLRGIIELRKRIRNFRPDVLVYLAEPRGRAKALRDAIFFKSCGIRQLYGVPLSTESRRNHLNGDANRHESEARRLARCIRDLGDARLDDPASWSLHLSATERLRADKRLRDWDGGRHFIACSLGTKFETNDWGEANWRALFGRVNRTWPDLGLLFIGAGDEFASSERAGADFGGPKLNLCGQLQPRESAAVLQRAVLFIGHDSGPLHLAASVGTQCVAIFSARNKPGVWFPWGPNHKVIYHQTHCYGCGLEKCTEYNKMCITSVTVTEVEDAIREMLPFASSYEGGAEVMSGR
jgi:ADP-heptose:LPS heptosyltransferase